VARKRQRPRGQGSLYKRNGAGPWIARWHDHVGKRRERSTRTTDKAAAERILAQRVADAALRKGGVIDARTDGYAEAERRPLAEHLADWRAGLIAQGRTEKHVGMLLSRATAILDAAHANYPDDLSASRIQEAIGELHSAGRSLQTCHHYLRACKQFTRWLHRDGRIREDRLAHLGGYNASTDRRLERRALTPEEVGLLLDTTEHAPKWRGMSGPDRAMLYRVAVGTGFRANELRSLTPRSFSLDGDTPSVTVQAVDSKHRRRDAQPIRPDLAAVLRPWLASKPSDAPMFGVPEKTAEMIRLDLRRARARWIKATTDRAERQTRRQSDFLAVVDHDGQRVDFHALRVTFITWLVQGGAQVKAA